MPGSTGARRLHGTTKEDFAHFHLPKVGKNVPRRAQSFNIVPLSLEHPADRAGPTAQGAPGHSSLSLAALLGARQGHACLIPAV